MSYSGKIAKHDATILMLDENREPIIECEWDKRKKCDSFYIEMYLKQKRQIDKAIEYCECIYIPDSAVNIAFQKVLEILKGDSNE